MPRTRRALAALAVVVVVAAGVLAGRAARLSSPQVTAEPAARLDTLPGAIARLQAAVRIPTISDGDTSAAAVARRDEAFGALHAQLAVAFPRVHAVLRREVVGRHALLYTWEGSDGALAPVVLLAHLDVVPVEAGTEGRWTHAPFEATVADGHVWGRGTLDDKGSALAQLEAVEALLAQGHRPRRTVLLAFGDDEEVGGNGAAAIAQLVGSRGIRPALVLDEGGFVTDGIVPGARAPVALVGAAEKGYASVEIVVAGTGGHSSAPPRHTAAGRLAAVVTRLEATRLPPRRGGAAALLFDHLAPDLAPGYRLLFANRDVFAPVITRVLAGRPSTDATQRTTTAVTMLEASPKDNVLPGRARAVVNFRLMPGDAVGDVVAHVERVAHGTLDDSTVTVRLLEGNEASAVSAVGSPAWTAVARTVRQLWPDALVAPYLVTGATDARHWHAIADDVYRFLPLPATSDVLERMHGTDERVGVADYARAVAFYGRLLVNMEG